METKDAETQPELFQQFNAQSKAKGSARGTFYENKFKLMLKLEEVMLGAIGIVALMVIVFSVGVERGRLSEYKNSLKTRVSANIQQAVKTPVKAPVEKAIPAPVVTAPKQEPVVVGGFMVRLATYRSGNDAGTEALSLKGRGYPAMFEKKGDYYLVSVGPYIKLDEAKRQLSQLKGKKYPDAYIKKR